MKVWILVLLGVVSIFYNATQLHASCARAMRGGGGHEGDFMASPAAVTFSKNNLQPSLSRLFANLSAPQFAGQPILERLDQVITYRGSIIAAWDPVLHAYLRTARSWIEVFSSIYADHIHKACIKAFWAVFLREIFLLSEGNLNALSPQDEFAKKISDKLPAEIKNLVTSQTLFTLQAAFLDVANGRPPKVVNLGGQNALVVSSQESRVADPRFHVFFANDRVRVRGVGITQIASVRADQDGAPVISVDGHEVRVWESAFVQSAQ